MVKKRDITKDVQAEKTKHFPVLDDFEIPQTVNDMEEDGISSRRKHMDDEVSDVLGDKIDEDDKDMKSRKSRRLARRRRHNAQSQNDQLAESGFVIPEMILDERKIEGDSVRKREKKYNSSLM